METTPRVTFWQRRLLRFRIRTWLSIILLSPAILWGALNLVFSSTWGTGFLERRIENGLGLPCRIQSVTWSPWGGVQIRGVRILSPVDSGQSDDVVRIEKIVVDPSWASLASGEKRWDRLEVNELNGKVSIELLKEIMARYQKASTISSLGSKALEPDSTSTGTEGLDQGGVKEKDGISPLNRSEESKGDESQAQEDASPDLIPVDDFEGTITISNSRFRLYSESIPEFSAELNGVEGELPVWGAARSGEVRIASFEVGSRFSEKSLTFPFLWKDSFLEIENHPIQLFGLDLEISAALRFTRGMPIGLGIDLPDQQIDLTPIYLQKKPPISISHIQSQSVLRGSLVNPRSFTGHSFTSFQDFVFHDLLDGGDTRFDRGSALVKLSGSGIFAEDIRVIGSEDAVLMNGFATIDGEAAATVRIVSSPERAGSHRKRVEKVSSRLSLDFEPLITPDREYRDIRIEAREDGLMMDLGKEGEWIPFVSVVRSVLGEQTFDTPTLP